MGCVLMDKVLWRLSGFSMSMLHIDVSTNKLNNLFYKLIIHVLFKKINNNISNLVKKRKFSRNYLLTYFFY